MPDSSRRGIRGSGAARAPQTYGDGPVSSPSTFAFLLVLGSGA
jgi:hypothetical protein